MIEQITKEYKITCDRCGVTERCNTRKPSIMGYNKAGFHTENKSLKWGYVCDLCYKDFCELAENFFDEVNNEVRDDDIL